MPFLAIIPLALLSHATPVQKMRIKRLEKKVEKLKSKPTTPGRKKRIRTLEARLANIKQDLQQKQDIKAAKERIRKGQKPTARQRTAVNTSMGRPATAVIKTADIVVAEARSAGLLDTHLLGAEQEEAVADQTEPIEVTDTEIEDVIEEIDAEAAGGGFPWLLAGAAVVGIGGAIWFFGRK